MLTAKSTVHLYTHTWGYPPAAHSCSHTYKDRDRVWYIHMVINLRQWQRHIWDKFKAYIIPLNFWCMEERAFPPCSRTLLSMGKEWGGETFSEVLSGDGPRAAWGTQLLFLSVNSWQGGKGDFSWCSYPQLLGTSENHREPHKSKHRRRKNNLRLFQMWKDGSKQGNRDRKQVSHSLRDEGVFIQAFFGKEHARGIHLSFLLAFSSCSDLHVSGGTRGNGNWDPRTTSAEQFP